MLGLANNSNNQLRSLNASASYIYDNTWSLTAGRVSVGGTADAALLRNVHRQPEQRRLDLRACLSAVQPRRPVILAMAEFRIGLQYTHWNKFAGATTNFDGMGRNAHDNNRSFAYIWTMF
jgi:hypothetical protein